MRWDSTLDPSSLDSYLKKTANNPNIVAPLNPMVADNLKRIKQRAGWLAPEVQLALAKSNASDEVVDAAGNLKAKQIASDQVSPEPRSIPTKIYDNLKAVSRWGTAAFNFVPEFAQGAVAQIFDKNTSIDGWFASTTLGTMIENPELRGEGFFLSEEGMKKQGERARKYRGTVNGSAWTVGRAAANLVFRPNTKPYNILSGSLDAMALIKVDPTGPVTKTFRQLNKSRYMVPLLTKADVNPAILNLADEAGISHNILGASVNGQKFLKFWDDNPRARELVDRLVEEKSAVRIADEIFDGGLDNDVVVRLADAKTRDEVIDALAGGFMLDNGSLVRDVRNYQGILPNAVKAPVKEIVERIPMVDGIRKSRWFTTMPENQIVLNGTSEDNRKAAINIVRYLRTANVAEETVNEIGEQAYRTFVTDATSVDQKKVLDLFNATVDASLQKQGLDRDTIEVMRKKAVSGIDQMRQYMIDRTGKVTDGKMYRFMTSTNQDYLPSEEIENMLEIFGNQNIQMQAPLQIVELLNRTQFLPDPREIRRATSNPFLSKFTNVRFASKTAKRNITRIKEGSEKIYSEAQNELANLARQYPVKTKLPEDVAERIAELNNILADAQETVVRRVNLGEQRAAVEFLDTIQNRVWKPLALATGGYVLRNSMDAQVRMAFAGLNSAITHPFEYMMLVLGRSQKRSLGGESLLGYKTLDEIGSRLAAGEKLADITGESLTDFEKTLRQDLRFGLREMGLDADDVGEISKKSNSWAQARRDQPNGIELHTDGVMNNMTLFHSDPLERIAAEGLAVGQDRELIVRRMVVRVQKDKKLLAEIEGIYSGGGRGAKVVADDGTTGLLKGFKPFKNMEPDELDRFLTQHMYRVVLGNVETQTGNMADLQFMAAFNQIPKTTYVKGRGLRRVPALERDATTLINVDKGDVRVGSLVQISDNEVGVVTALRNEEGRIVIDPFSEQVVSLDNQMATIVPVTGENAFGKLGQGVSDSRRLVKQMPLYDEVEKFGLPPVVKREILKTEADSKGELFPHSVKAMDKFTNWFFGELYGKTSTVLDRSPVFRQYYFQIIKENADMLDPEQAEVLLQNISERAAKAKMKPQDFIGDKEVLKVLKASTLTKGTAKVEELDDYARFMALQQTKELLYDASNKTNLEDALRIIMPFAPAWREVLGTYIGFTKGNPLNTARSFQRVYSGALGADPDNDGRGFFYKDPTTGQIMFTFPGSGTLAKILTGVNAPLEAPIKRFSQGINAYPSLGPMVQVAYSQLVPDIPQLDGVKDFLLPYGEKTIGTAFNPTPQWLDKFVQAIKADTGKLDNVYGNTYAETLRALSASGDYNIDDPNSVNELLADAKGKARILTLLRAASQFIGPTSGATEFKIPTAQGDQFVSSLVKEFYDLQAKDYDTAVPKFLELYGDEVTLYTASKTRSLQEGLEATQEFSDWERRNGDLLSQYADTAAYLAPAGSEFNFTVWQRQLSTGKRERLSDREIIEIAQQRIGSAKYRAARRLIGPYPNEAQKSILAQYREVLHSQYPGFPLRAEFTVGKFDNDVEQLKNLVDDPRVSNNASAKVIAEYLQYRDQAIAQYVATGGKASGFGQAKSAVGLRDALASIGESLSQREPGFARVWQRLLAQEVEE